MELSEIEIRILGSLIEKERTTPEHYPLTTGALTAACNQRTSREPVTDYHQQDIRSAMQNLRDRALVRTLQEVRDRVPKHQQRLSEVLDLSPTQAALMAVLMLRGAQTAAELRSRTERYGEVGSLAEVEAALGALEARERPLARNVGRAPGQSQDRWAHQLGSDPARLAPRVRPTLHQAENANGSDAASRLSDLEAQVEELQARITALEVALRGSGDAAFGDPEPRDGAP